MATFYIEAVENTNIALVMVGSPTIGTVKYGVNDSTCPNAYTVTTTSTPISLTAGQKCYWTITSTSTNFSSSNYLKFTSTAKINVGGNMSDLIGGETQIPRNYCFYGLFYSCANLIDASNLVVVNDFNSKSACYSNMFQNCTSLKTAPALPATTLTSQCYRNMFRGCASLITAPELPATTLATFCYQYMFYGCTSLTTAPALLATTLTTQCYQFMFDSCSSLITAPTLPATTLADSCYSYMFRDCTSITTAPALPATTVKSNCYLSMFSGCTSIKIAPALPATTLASDCYFSMFQDCTSLTIAPELPTTTLASNCYSEMFSGCTSLTIAPELPATTLADYCYYYMFDGCTSLTTVPTSLPSTTLTNQCYSSMFRGCTSLTTTPELPATTLADSCYSGMFRGCTSLATLPKLPATTLENECYSAMFHGCTNIKLSETQTAPYSIPYRIPSEGTGTIGTISLNNMFTDTGGTFTGTPTINTTYYLVPYATFYIEAVEDTDITLSKVGSPTVGDACYGIDDHGVSNVYNYGDTIHLTVGQKCYWFITSTSTSFGPSKCLNFTSTAKINVGGNLSDLIGGNTRIPRNYCFCRLFDSCTSLIDASNLVVVNDFNSKSYCYYAMFTGCTSLTTAPELPATTLADYCYNYMFSDCTSFTIAPASLPATTLANYCYASMFYNCTSLTTAPALPATTLADYCYGSMFEGCTSLTTPPELPATTLADSCYNYMFYNCTSLATPPELPATTLADSCYEGMFFDCTNIKLSETQIAPYLIAYRIPSEGTGTIGTSSLDDMFYNTGGTFKGTPTINTTYYLVPYATFYIEAVEDTDITLSKVGTPTIGDAYYGVENHTVPNAYTYGDTIHLTVGQKCYWFITSTSTAFSSSNYLNFTSTAKINVGGNLSDLIGEESKIPRNYCFYRLFHNCDNLIDASNLTIVNNFYSKTYCYSGMFQGCASLTAPPQIPATTLTNYCYYNMFYSCTSLTTPPELPATTLAASCYFSMFGSCSSLTTVPELPATTLTNYCYYNMFYNCTSLTTPPALPATTLAVGCYSYMFQGCTNIKLSETQIDPYSIPYRIPSEGTGAVGTSSLDDMFTNTGGTFKGTPTINKIYYLAPPSSPIYITYKGQELANFESGSKTIKCGGKYMEGDVIIAREIGTNNVVVLYNSATILTFQNGTKTLKCAGKGMATDLVIQTS